MDPGNDGAYQVERYRCHACAPLDRARTDDRDPDDNHGLKLIARRT